MGDASPELTRRVSPMLGAGEGGSGLELPIAADVALISSEGLFSSAAMVFVALLCLSS